MRATRLRYALAAALLPVGYTAYLLAIGYWVPETLRASGTLAVVAGAVVGLSGEYVYVLSLAALGAGALAARARDLRASVALLAVGLPAYPWVRFFGPRPSVGGDAFAFTADVLLAAVTFGVVATAEYAVRNRGRLARSLSARTAGLALAAGVAHFLGFVFVRSVLGGASVGRPSVFTAALWTWLFVGLVLTAGIPMLFAAELRLLAPPTVVSVAFASAAVETLAELPKMGIAPSPMSMYGLAWFVPLALALAAAGAEWLLRKRFGVGPSLSARS